MRKYVLAALVAGTFATPALAQDATPFTGPRIEGIIGYDNGGTEERDDNSDGIVYGAGVGYDFQMGGLVAGIEGEFTDSTVDECTPGVIVAGDEICAQVGRDFYAGGRIGTLVGPSTLLYAKAGYTNGRLETEYDDGVEDGTGDFETGDNLDGARLGAGAEFAVGPNSYLKTEYRYSNYEQGFEKHQVVAGFGFRF